MKGYESWTISEEFWNKISGLIPEYQRDPNRVYKRKPGGGRKSPDKRKILRGIFYVLRTGCQWKAIPSEFGKGSNIHRYFQLWERAGFFEAIWAMALEEYDELKGLEWEWQSMDGCITKAPLCCESGGANPTDRGKKWNQEEPTCRRARFADSDNGFWSKYARRQTVGEYIGQHRDLPSAPDA
jgi:transposase